MWRRLAMREHPIIMEQSREVMRQAQGGGVGGVQGQQAGVGRGIEGGVGAAPGGVVEVGGGGLAGQPLMQQQQQPQSQPMIGGAGPAAIGQPVQPMGAVAGSRALPVGMEEKKMAEGAGEY